MNILIVGTLTTKHISTLVTKLGASKKEVEKIYVFDSSFRVGYKYPDIPGIEHVYGVESNCFFKILSKIPKVRAWAFSVLLKRKVKEVISSENIQFVSFVGVTTLTSSMIRYAHHRGAKTHIAPLGSDVLRSSKLEESALQKAFKEIDFVTVGKNNEFGIGLINRFHIPDKKIVYAGFGSDVIDIIDRMIGTQSRKELSLMLNLPESSHYIACGYNASRDQNHKEILKALAENKKLLPKDYCVIIQLSYGSAKEDLYRELSELSHSLALNVVFIMDFLSLEKVAALRILTDLFIHVQKTDATNASILEYLLADTQVINGSWLKYKFIEKYGFPYYRCDSISELSMCINNVLSGDYPRIMVSGEVKEAIRSFKSWKLMLERWHSLFEKSINNEGN